MFKFGGLNSPPSPDAVTITRGWRCQERWMSLRMPSNLRSAVKLLHRGTSAENQVDAYDTIRYDRRV